MRTNILDTQLKTGYRKQIFTIFSNLTCTGDSHHTMFLDSILFSLHCHMWCHNARCNVHTQSNAPPESKKRAVKLGISCHNMADCHKFSSLNETQKNYRMESKHCARLASYNFCIVKSRHSSSLTPRITFPGGLRWTVFMRACHSKLLD